MFVVIVVLVVIEVFDVIVVIVIQFSFIFRITVSNHLIQSLFFAITFFNHFSIIFYLFFSIIFGNRFCESLL